MPSHMHLFNMPKDLSAAPPALSVVGALPNGFVGMDYEEFLQVVNPVGKFTVEVLENGLPAGNKVLADNFNKRIVVSFPAWTEDAVSPQGNWDFEGGDDGQWDLTSDGAGLSIGGGDGYDTYNGSRSLRYANHKGTVSARNINFAPVSPGDQLNASCWIQQGASDRRHTSGRVVISWHDENYGLLPGGEGTAWVVGNLVDSGSGGEWKQSVLNGATAPVGAKYAQLSISLNRVRQNLPMWADAAYWDAQYRVGSPTTGVFPLHLRVKDSLNRYAYWSGEVVIGEPKKFVGYTESFLQASGLSTVVYAEGTGTFLLVFSNSRSLWTSPDGTDWEEHPDMFPGAPTTSSTAWKMEWNPLVQEAMLHKSSSSTVGTWRLQPPSGSLGWRATPYLGTTYTSAAELMPVQDWWVALQTHMYSRLYSNTASNTVATFQGTDYPTSRGVVRGDETIFLATRTDDIALFALRRGVSPVMTRTLLWSLPHFTEPVATTGQLHGLDPLTMTGMTVFQYSGSSARPNILAYRFVRPGADGVLEHGTSTLFETDLVPDDPLNPGNLSMGYATPVYVPWAGSWFWPRIPSSSAGTRLGAMRVWQNGAQHELLFNQYGVLPVQGTYGSGSVKYAIARDKRIVLLSAGNQVLRMWFEDDQGLPPIPA